MAVAEAPAQAVKEVPAAKAEPAKEEKVAETKEEKGDADDLKKLEGVGPKLEEILNEAGITTYAGLAATSLEKLKEILEGAGSRYASKDPAPWIEQAKELAK
uniref:helix-hairpin-helix domain-containing protein n=1 Tax=Mariniphaga sediminis TaxID=1628158 RepID=UPI003743DE49